MPKQKELDQSMIDNIKNYGNEIEALKTFVEGVRKVPGMYIGHLGNRGFLNMFREIFQNSIDEIIKPKSPCNTVYVFYNERTHEITIEDNGRGYPFHLLIDGFINSHVSSNYQKEPGEYSSGRHGVGSKVVNALSDKFIVESYILGEARRIEFSDGQPSKKGIVKIKNPGKQGTKVYFHPSYEIMGQITTTPADILELIIQIMNQIQRGTKTIFEYESLDGSRHTQEIVNVDGINSFLYDMTSTPLIKPIEIGNDTGHLKADMTLTFDSTALNGEMVQSFSNTCPAKGTHLNGFMVGLCRFFRNYMNKIYLASNKKNKLTVVDSDIKAGLRAVISVFHLYPTYSGQAKEDLDNEDMYDFVNKLVHDGLDQWAKANPTDLQKVCKLIKEVAEIRSKADEGKIKLSNNYKSSLLNNGMPAKYSKPAGKPKELWICEGDSALGSLRSGRDKMTQGVFPIRGKLPNAFSTPQAKMLKNEEISAILTIVGGGYGKNFNIDNVPWEKVVLGSDADVDGAHIANLFLMFALVYMRPLVEDGRLYRAMPPLFGMKIGGPKRNNKSGYYDPNSQSESNSAKYRYFTTKLDYVKYCQQLFSKNHVIETVKGKRLSQMEVVELIFRNEDYVEYIDNIANTFAIDKLLLELVLINLESKNFKKTIESKYRFLKVNKVNGIVIIEGTIDKSQTVILNERMLHICEGFKELKEANMDMYYKVDGQVMSIYQIMQMISQNAPKDITRYKGLGEMNPSQLRDSTLNQENRTLVRYTVKDIEDEINTIRYLESNKADLLKGVGNLKRRDLE